jgi:hypothetical protein
MESYMDYRPDLLTAEFPDGHPLGMRPAHSRRTPSIASWAPAHAATPSTGPGLPERGKYRSSSHQGMEFTPARGAMVPSTSCILGRCGDMSAAGSRGPTQARDGALIFSVNWVTLLIIAAVGGHLEDEHDPGDLGVDVAETRRVQTATLSFPARGQDHRGRGNAEAEPAGRGRGRCIAPCTAETRQTPRSFWRPGTEKPVTGRFGTSWSPGVLGAHEPAASRASRLDHPSGRMPARLIGRILRIRTRNSVFNPVPGTPRRPGYPKGAIHGKQHGGLGDLQR